MRAVPLIRYAHSARYYSVSILLRHDDMASQHQHRISTLTALPKIQSALRVQGAKFTLSRKTPMVNAKKPIVLTDPTLLCEVVPTNARLAVWGSGKDRLPSENPEETNTQITVV